MPDPSDNTNKISISGPLFAIISTGLLICGFICFIFGSLSGYSECERNVIEGKVHLVTNSVTSLSVTLEHNK